MDLKLKGKSVLVTGGSRGIGRQIALAFAEEQARVAICARDQSQLDKTAQELKALGADTIAMSVDLTRAEDCQRVVDETVAAFGGIDILVNNAGTNVDRAPSKLGEASEDQLMERVSGKALAAIRCSRAAIPYMQKAGGGRIVCIAGTSARNVSRGRERPSSDGNPVISGLGNAMITNFGKMLAEQNARDGILVNVIHPGVTKTDRHPNRMKKRAAELGISEAEAEADLASYVPIGRIVEPTDIAPLVVLLCSPVNGAITGQTIAVDGGFCRGIFY
jgi:3-oxoacyl-[acyl-carrier protein] reductase